MNKVIYFLHNKVTVKLKLQYYVKKIARIEKLILEKLSDEVKTRVSISFAKEIKSSWEFSITSRINREKSARYLLAARSSLLEIKLFTELSALKIKCGFIWLRNDFKDSRLLFSFSCCMDLYIK